MRKGSGGELLEASPAMGGVNFESSDHQAQPC